MGKKKSGMVVVKPVAGFFLHEYPSIAQELPGEEAEAVIKTGAFELGKPGDLPEPEPEPEAPVDESNVDSGEPETGGEGN